MSKVKTVFVCQECGYTSSKWMGKCPDCNEWNTLFEETRLPKSSKPAVGVFSAPEQVGNITGHSEERIRTNVGELDGVLGGGLLPGSLVLVGGEPGIGKSTLLLQICNSLTKKGAVLYVSGEESGQQIKLRADRLGITSEKLYVQSETDIEAVFVSAENLSPAVIIVDSVQTMYSAEISSAAGSVSQVREITLRLMRYAKETGTAVFVVGHVTKDGSIAGPRVLEHMVDCVLYFEGERTSSYRILRAVKNRFGSTNEIGMFEMGEKGLSEVKNPSAALLSERPDDTSGSAVFCTTQGTRPILAEVQALVSPTGFGIPRRMASGMDIGRVNLLIAVLEKRLGYNLQNQDAYINVIGGMKIDETAADLSVAAAIVSSFKNKRIPAEMVFLGEIGLTGELRSVSQIQQRVNEAARMGFTDIVLPYECIKLIKDENKKIKLLPAKNVREAIEYFI